MKKSQYKFVFGNGMTSSWYPEDYILNSWDKLPPSIINSNFSAIIVEEQMTKEEFKKRYPDIKI